MMKDLRLHTKMSNTLHFPNTNLKTENSQNLSVMKHLLDGTTTRKIKTEDVTRVRRRPRSQNLIV